MLRVVCITALLGLFGAGAKSQPVPEQNPPSAQQQANPEQRGTEQAPFVIRIAPAQEILDKSKPVATETEDGRETTWSGIFKEWGLSDKIAAITGLVVFFQLLALLVTMRVIFRNSRRQSRAYVSMDAGSARLVNDPNGEPILEGYVKVKNFGRTPAFQYRSYALIKVANVNAPPFEETSVVAGGGIPRSGGRDRPASLLARFGWRSGCDQSWHETNFRLGGSPVRRCLREKSVFQVL